MLRFSLHGTRCSMGSQMKHLGKSHLVVLLIGLVLGAIALGVVQAAISVTSEVRIGVRPLEDGRVEVKLQQLEAEQWTDLDAPPARFLPPDAGANEWRYSSSIEVVGTSPEPAVVEPERPVMCVHGHAYPEDDRFWRWTLAGSNVVGHQYGVEMRLYAANDSAEHINDIRDCISNDPITIATSLPYADDLRDVLAEAQGAGIQVVTFNSGAEDADSVGSLMHIGLDDFGGGVRAGDEFDEAGVTGTLLCVIHEDDNIGLQDRCDGAAQSYDGGEVERISVDLARATELGGVHGEHTRPEHLDQLIQDRIAQGDVGAILTLNHDSAVAAMTAIEEADAEVRALLEGISDSQRLLVTFHDAFGYFARRYGLEIAGFVVEGPEQGVSADALADLIELIEHEGVQTVFHEPQFDASILDTVADESGAARAIIWSQPTEDNPTYIGILVGNARAIAGQ